MIEVLKKRWYIFIILFLIIGFFVYKRTSSQAETKKDQTYVVKRDTIRETISLSGKVDAREKATLQFQAPGRLATVAVKEGQYVEQGQLVAALDQRQVKKAYQKYLNTYLKTRYDFETQKSNYETTDLWKLNEVQKQNLQRVFDKSQADLNNAVIDVELQNLSMQDANLTTPIGGIVTRVDAPLAGVNIIPTQATFEVINPNTIFFSILADQTEVVKVREGFNGEILLDPFPDKKFSGTVSEISYTPQVGESGTVYEVKMDIPADVDLRLGMTGDATFILREKANVLTVPVNFVKTEGEKKYVMKDVKGTPTKTYVETGDTDDTVYEITSGLSEGDTVYDQNQ